MADPIATIQAASNTVSALSVLLDSLGNFVPKLIAACSFIAAVLPKPDPASRFYPFLHAMRSIINGVAFNVRHAKNRED